MNDEIKSLLSSIVKKSVARAYQEIHFDEIADAIRYVYETTKEEDMIVALDFYKRIRAIKSMIGPGTGGKCRLGDNVPDGCGENHGLLHLDYTLVNCVTEKLVDFREVVEGMCLCDDHWAYGPPACGGLHGLHHLDYTPMDCAVSYSTLWGYDDAGN